MRYRISEVRIGAKQYADPDLRMNHIEKALRRKLRRLRSGSGRGKGAEPEISVSNIEIIRESIDARKKPDVKAVYTLDFDCPHKLPLPEGGRQEYESLPAVFAGAAQGAGAAAGAEFPRPVIAGFGPCGIFAALILAEAGLRPIVLERGKRAEERLRDVQRFWEQGILDPESNVQFGEGGAGTFSDGKLTTGIRDVRIRKVLQVFTEAGADPAILYQQRPHIGTDQLHRIIPAIRRRIEQAGGEIRFGTKLAELELAGAALTGVQTVCGGRTERIAARHLILAIGHSARDTFRMLQETGLDMQPKPFSIGVRIEHPQERIDAAQYGDPALAEVFGPASYKLHYRCENGRGVYTFCMCPGGRVINASSEEGGTVTNGMSESRRDSGTANSGLLVDVRTSDFPGEDPLAGVEFQRRYEALAREMGKDQDGGLPRTVYGRFGQESDPVRRCLPAFAAEAIAEAMPHLGRMLRGFDDADTVMTAVETRSSSPVRILRGDDMQTKIRGIMPAGEGPGYAGGIMSAAVDGIRAAEQIIREYAEENTDKKE
ncbi:MAG: NAD(FAD)-utilizing dehydrogenase [Firmicutes bacterium]|nr:NAD(FAD)-utilizing dehydrogenase [Bacillota bacterium]